MYKNKTKIIASILVLLITITHFNVLGQVLATSLEAQKTTTNNANVEFDAYFKEENSKVHSAIKTIGAENYLYAQIEVKEAGYLKNAILQLDDANFKVKDALSSSKVSKVEENKIYFNQIKNGNTVEIEIPIEMVEIENNRISLTDIYKQSTAKLSATYVDEDGKEKKIEKDITVSLAWTGEKTAELNAEVITFLPYELNGQKVTILQIAVESYLKDNTLPVKENNIEISIPTINETKPEEVKLTVNSTKATNGSKTAENYTYNIEENSLTIKVKNDADEQGKVAWEKQAKDECILTCIYNEEIQNDTKITLEANNELTLYEASETKAHKTISKEEILQEEIGDIVSFEIGTTTKELSKGQMYANYETTVKKETQYNKTVTANIKMAQIQNTDLIDKLVFEITQDNFVNADNTKIEENNNTYIKELKINKTLFTKILGEEGSIKLYTTGLETIATIDNNSSENEEGNIVVDLTTFNTNNLKVETSKPITEGKLTFELTKAIKQDISYNKEQMQKVAKLEIKANAKVVKENSNIEEKELTNEITLIEPTSQVELLVDNTNLSTVVTNQNVKITAILKTDKIDTNLYKDPVLNITVPSYIEAIDVKNVEVVFVTEGSKLALKNYNVIKNADGTSTIVVELQGMQTEYTLDAVSKGVNVIITTDITTNKLTPNKQEQMKLTCTNKSTNEVAEAVALVNFVAPTGVITTTTISNYAEAQEPLTIISKEEKVATIPIMSEARNAKFEMTVINNYKNTIDNISILGRIPAKQNKEITTGEDLKSTIDMPLVSNITVNSKDNNKVKVYYSENINATKDLTLSSNGWTLTPTDLSKVKSYLIVLTDYTMNTADTISFTYEAQIPANLQHNSSAYGNYVVYFNNNLETGTIQDSESATKIGITTGKGPILETTISTNTEETVLTGKFIKYTVKVKNAGEEITENVKVTVDLPKYLNIVNFFEGESGQYTKDYTSTQYIAEIGSIKPNEEITKSFIVIVNKLSVEDICKDESHYETYNGEKYHKQDITHSDSEYKATASLKAVVIAKDLSKAIESAEVTNTIKNAYFNISTSTTTNGLDVLNEGDTFVYNISAKLYEAGKTAKNTTVKVVIPSELEYEKAEISKFNSQTDSYDTTTDGISFNTKNRELTINLGDLTYEDSKNIKITSKVKALNEGEYEKNINSVATILADGIDAETSNSIIDTISKEGIEVIQTSSVPDGNTLSAGEKVSYKFTIKNIGGNIIGNLKLTDNLPKEVEYINTTYTVGEETKTINNINNENATNLSISIPKGETAVVTINVITKQIDEKAKIENKATITTDTINTETNKISHIVEATEYEKPGDVTTIVRKISGQVWKDENNDGIKDENEARVPGIEVLLFNNETGKLVTDKDSNILKAITDENGKYTFQSVSKGKYTVIYLYDTANYSSTTYRKDGVDDTKNSDSIDSKITIDGQERIAGITEEINVADSNIYNIDLGLVSNPKFDLKLEKTVTKITIQDGKNTDVYNYKDVKIAKKDLIGKDVNNTSIIVEYKLKVTNEGAIAGYVKKLVDYMPSEMKFSSELNKDWYTSENGILYNSSLSNTLINPGESKEVTLILTKKMTEDNLGLYHNTAEIYEAYNDLGIQDVDSTPGNNKTEEDDTSSADVLITLKTGKTITFFGLSITIISTIAIGAYFIKKKVLR